MSILIRGVDVVSPAAYPDSSGASSVAGPDAGAAEITDNTVGWGSTSNTVTSGSSGLRDSGAISGSGVSGTGLVTLRKGVNIYIVDDVIADISQKDYPEADIVIDGRDMVALPGLVNAHTHAAMTLFRGMADDIPLDLWLNQHIWPAEEKLTAEDVYWGTKLSLIEMIKSGTTAFADMYFLMDEVVRAVEEAGIRASLSVGMTSFEEDFEDTLKRGKDFISRWNGTASGRITAMYGPHAPYTCTPGFLRAVAQEAKRDGAGIHIHLAETVKEIEEIQEKYGLTPVELAAEAGLFDVHVLAAHCVHLTPHDMEILAESGAAAAHNPQSNLKLGSGIAPVPTMLRQGVIVALGTDGAASNNNLDLLEEMQTAAVLHKGVNLDPTLVTAAEALCMATVNGAYALGLSNTGLVQVGKKADIILMDLNQARLIPRWDTLSNIVYSAASSDIKAMIVDGRLIMKDRKILTFDEEETYFEVNKRFRRFAQ